MTRKTMPGADRITMQQLQGQKRALVDALAAHVKLCAQCSLAETDVYVHCREWWRTKFKLHEVQRHLTAHNVDINPQQIELSLTEEPK